MVFTVIILLHQMEKSGGLNDTIIIKEFVTNMLSNMTIIFLA